MVSWLPPTPATHRSATLAYVGPEVREARSPGLGVVWLDPHPATNPTSKTASTTQALPVDRRLTICQYLHMAHDPVTGQSSLGHALLGVLARGAATGYGLAQQMQRPIGYFWEASHSQIYPELARLEKAALVESTAIAGRGPRQTKRYALTPAGRHAQQRWLSSPMRSEPTRDLQTLRTWSLWLAGPAQAKLWIEGRRAHHLAILATYKAERQQLRNAKPTPGNQQWCNLAAVELGIRSRQAELQWCSWMLDQIDQWEEPASHSAAHVTNPDDLATATP